MNANEFLDMLEQCDPAEARSIVACALNRFDGGTGEYNTEDWELAGVVMKMTDKMRIDPSELPRYEAAADDIWRTRT